jgi:hypothetical protein
LHCSHQKRPKPILDQLTEALDRALDDEGTRKRPLELANDVPDPQMVAEHFAILVVGIPRMLALLVGREPPPEEERRLRCAVKLFLDGCRLR